MGDHERRSGRAAMIGSSRIGRTVLGVLGLLTSAVAWGAGTTGPVATVHWLIVNEPPEELLVGSDQGTGAFDVYRRALVTRLPQFSHTVELSNAKRRDAMMAEGDPDCAVSMLSTPERRKHVVFAKSPFLYGLPVRLAMNEETARSIRAEYAGDAVSLDKVLASGKHHLGVYEKRHFGDSIDQQLQAIRAQHPDAVREFRDVGEPAGLFDLLARGRFDLILAYIPEAEYLSRQDARIGKLAYIPISGVDGLLSVSAGCSKSTLGNRVIDAINQLSDADALSVQATANYESWLPAEERQRYEHLLKSK